MDYPLPARCDSCQREFTKQELSKGLWQSVPGTAAKLCFKCHERLAIVEPGRGYRPVRQKELRSSVSDSWFTIPTDGRR